MLLLGKNIIVTGASRGLGRIIAKALWRDGANLLLVARSHDALSEVAEELESLKVDSSQVTFIASVDLAKRRRSVKWICEQAREWLSAVHGLVNNAAMLGPIGPAWENEWKEWKQTVQVNLLAPVALCQEFIPWMAETGGGSILNISGGGATSPRANFSAYACAKTALVRFTENLALEAKRLNVRVNALAPGAMPTDMLKEVLDAGPQKVGEADYRKALAQTEAGDAVAEKAAAACAFLLSDQAKDITGRLISAQWDPWEKLDSLGAELAATDIYTLRRIVPEDRGKKW